MKTKTAYNSGFTKWLELLKPVADFPQENLILAESTQFRSSQLRQAALGVMCHFRATHCKYQLH